MKTEGQGAEYPVRREGQKTAESGEPRAESVTAGYSPLDADLIHCKKRDTRDKEQVFSVR